MRILAINPGSTSTKLAVFDDERQVWAAGAHHPLSELSRFPRIADQYAYRRDFILEQLRLGGIALCFDAVIGRGGLLRPLQGGVYAVSDTMVEELRNAKMEHACNLGALLAREIADRCQCPALIADPVVVDELRPEARLTGLPFIERRSIFHALNHKATARRYAASVGRRYEDLRLVVAHLGGGVSVGAHCFGRVVDVNDALNGDGSFSTERSGALPAMQLADLCFGGKYTQAEVKRLICGKGGLTAWLGSNDMITIAALAEEGEQPHARVVEAMMYGVAKQVGAMHVALGCRTDAIIITGGIAHSQHCMSLLLPQIEPLAAVAVLPGENEMQSLASNALAALRGELPVQVYA